MGHKNRRNNKTKNKLTKLIFSIGLTLTAELISLQQQQQQQQPEMSDQNQGAANNEKTKAPVAKVGKFLTTIIRQCRIINEIIRFIQSDNAYLYCPSKR